MFVYLFISFDFLTRKLYVSYVHVKDVIKCRHEKTQSTRVSGWDALLLTLLLSYRYRPMTIDLTSLFMVEYNSQVLRPYGILSGLNERRRD